MQNIYRILPLLFSVSCIASLNAASPHSGAGAGAGAGSGSPARVASARVTRTPKTPVRPARTSYHTPRLTGSRRARSPYHTPRRVRRRLDSDISNSPQAPDAPARLRFRSVQAPLARLGEAGSKLLSFIIGNIHYKTLIIERLNAALDSDDITPGEYASLVDMYKDTLRSDRERECERACIKSYGDELLDTVAQGEISLADRDAMLAEYRNELRSHRMDQEFDDTTAADALPFGADDEEDRGISDEEIRSMSLEELIDRLYRNPDLPL